MLTYLVLHTQISALRMQLFLPTPAGLSPCLKELRRALGYTNQAIAGRFKPRCNRDGSYEKMQCLEGGSRGETCWCVDSNGKELIGTRVSGKASCIPESGRVGCKSYVANHKTSKTRE